MKFKLVEEITLEKKQDKEELNESLSIKEIDKLIEDNLNLMLALKEI